MKLLTVSTGQLEIARSQLRKPFLTVGRSPSCDVLLRAPGVQAIHFLIEWIGTGEFNSSLGLWSITDISKGENGEGIVFSERPVSTSGFTFTCVEDRLESTESIGGGIAQNIGTFVVAKSEILELIQVRTDSGAIEEVKHVRVYHGKRRERLLPKAREFKIEWNPKKAHPDSLVSILLEEMPEAEIFNRGQRVQPKNVCEVKAQDVLQIRWRNSDFFVRLVDEVKSPPIPRDLFGDALLRKLILSVGMLGALFFLMLWIFPAKEKVEEKPPIRVARVELAEIAAPPPAPAPKLKAHEVKKPIEKAPERVQPKAADKVQELVTTTTHAGKKVVASRPPSDKKLQVTDVNAVGILGALKKMGPKGPGIRADKMSNNSIFNEAVTDVGASKVTLRNPTPGTLGTGSSGSPMGKTSELGAASTTLSNVGKYDAGSVAPIAVKGGSSDFTIGTGTSQNVTGSRSSLGTSESVDFTVEGGGLDREMVRRVIVASKGQIRTCYERALLTQRRLEGRIVYDWRIGTDGSVVTVQMVKSTVDSSNLASCVLDIIKLMRFPQATNGRSTRVIYPFVFQGQK